MLKGATDKLYSVKDALSRPQDRPVFSAPKWEWKLALSFLLSMSLLGLRFYPAVLLVIIIMVNTWRRSRYHFMIQLLMFCGRFSLVNPHLLIIRRSDLLLVAGIAAAFIVRWHMKQYRRTIWLYLLYVVAVVSIAMTSIEVMTIQVRLMREYFGFIVFTVPLLIFLKKEFNASQFFRTVGVYALIMCCFFIIDSFILKGWVFIPDTPCMYGTPSFYHLIMEPFEIASLRKTPNGLMLLMFMAVPLLRFYRFNYWQWGLVLLAFAASRTMTTIAGLVLPYILLRGNARQAVKAMVICVVAVTGLYFVDNAIGSPMRIASTVQQFTNLDFDIEDREELSQLGSTRGAQIIPKMEALYEQNREWLGFGFIHPELSKSTAFQITNDLYSNIEFADENASMVEETHFSTILQIGYIGLIIQTVFYISLYFVIRRCRLRHIYLSALIATSVIGIGGLMGLNSIEALSVLAWAYAVVLLDYREQLKDDGKATA